MVLVVVVTHWCLAGRAARSHPTTTTVDARSHHRPPQRSHHSSSAAQHQRPPPARHWWLYGSHHCRAWYSTYSEASRRTAGVGRQLVVSVPTAAGVAIFTLIGGGFFSTSGSTAGRFLSRTTRSTAGGSHLLSESQTTRTKTIVRTHKRQTLLRPMISQSRHLLDP